MKEKIDRQVTSGKKAAKKGGGKTVKKVRKTWFSFPCWSNEGIFPCEAEVTPDLRETVETFGMGCIKLKHIAIKTIRLFMGLLPEVVAITNRPNNLFWPCTWFHHWKHAGDGHPMYIRRELIYMAVYWVRWRIVNDDSTLYTPTFIRLVNGKELATFLLDEWTETGEVCFADTGHGNRLVIREFHFTNPRVSSLYQKWFRSDIATMRVSEFDKFSKDFEESLGPYLGGIETLLSFSEETLYEQADYYNEKYADDPRMNRLAIRHVVGFYRFLAGQRNGYRIFEGGTMSYALLEKKAIVTYLMEGWVIVRMHDVASLQGAEKAVVVLERYMPLGTRYAPGETLTVNLSSVESPFYRRLIWRYLSRNLKLMIAGKAGTLAFALHVLEVSRGERGRGGRPFDNVDLAQIRVAVLDHDVSDDTAIVMLNTMRQFVRWLVEDPSTETDPDICPDILIYRREVGRGRSSVQAIPTEDFRKVMDYLKERAKTSYRGLLVHNALWIIATTGIRPSALCILKVNDIHPMPEDGYCLVYGPEKPSRGERDVWVFHNYAVNWLNEVLRGGADLRDECGDPDTREYAFLYRSTTGIARLEEGNLKAEIFSLCEKLGLPSWTPYSFRKLFGTAADELDRLMGYHGELARQMMGHRSYDTTRNHYVDATFEEFRRSGEPLLLSTDDMMLDEYLRVCGKNKGIDSNTDNTDTDK